MAKKKKGDFDYIWSDRKRTFLGLPWTFTTYFLTDTKFITRTGLLSLSEDELDLYKVTDKKLVLPFWQRLVGCGTIMIYVRDTDTPIKEVHCVKKPREVLAQLDKAIEGQRDRYGTRGRDLYAIQGGRGMAHHHHDDDDCDDCHYDHDDDGFDGGFDGGHHR
ncbi:MAG: PH domain-containing protein [Oscillospiraceae bacterium]|nr:PH domain-containing protein [Oscillospiraceae bacterium]